MKSSGFLVLFCTEVIRSYLNDSAGNNWTSLNPYSAGMDFSRQILTTKVDPRTVSR